AVVLFRPGLPWEFFAQTFVSGLNHYPLLAIAFFFFAGELMNFGGITQRLVDFANGLVGHIRGGLAHVNVVASMFMAGISGSAVADAAAIGSVLIPSMKLAGYSASFSAAITETASVIGPIIPPSIPMIVFAVLAEVSVGRMFVGGIIPGIIVGFSLMGVAYVISRRRGYPRGDRPSLARIGRTAWRAALPLIAPVIIVGGILGGVFTATEAGAVAVLYALVVGGLAFRQLRFRDVWGALLRSAHGTAKVMIIIGSCTVFAWVAADMQISQKAVDLLFGVSREPWAVLLMLNIFLLIVGLFLDPTPALIILVPILFPIVTAVGINPIHFGIIMVINLLIGLCTPPVGFLIYLTASIADCRAEEVVRESVPFVLVLVAVLFLCTYV
ncbi:MAG TPA: TRAP transporter large permease, partial [Candidatus Acidoferrum sp.]|nr:TRAP transporter large permease [Candidatus Acidoferrum sp.]